MMNNNNKCKICNNNPKTPYINRFMKEMHIKTYHKEELDSFIESFFIDNNGA